MMKSLFVTGTDTGVGKTTVSVGLASFLSLKKGMDVGVMKPFESGLSKRDKDSLPWDAICLKEGSGSADDLDIISPYTFEAPLAPEVASQLEHVQIDMNMVDRMYEKLRTSHELLIIEGAGGVLVPITKDFFYVDLIRRWKAPTLIVSRLGLGTINHTLLTNHYLQSQGISVVGVILNDTEGLEGLAARTNPDILKRYLGVPVFGVFPHVEGLLREGIDREKIAATFAEHIDTDLLLSRIRETQRR
jgi:dethiobiotin synthetase